MSLLATVGGIDPANTYSGRAWEAQRIVGPMTTGQPATGTQHQLPINLHLIE